MTVTVLNEDETVAVCDFEALAPGNRIGQEHWVKPEASDQIVTDDAINGTEVVRPVSENQGPAGETPIGRNHNAGFRFAAFTGDTAEIQFDITGEGMLTTADNKLAILFSLRERQLAILTTNHPEILAGTEGMADSED